MAFVSDYAQQKKLEYFFSKIPKDAQILEVGCAAGWVGRWAIAHGWKNFVGIDIVNGGPYDHQFIQGDINDWQALGLKKASFDFIIAFELIEHGNFYEAMYELLKPGGQLFVTSPLPHMDWACKTLEVLSVLQPRTSEHTHLIYMRDVPHFRLEKEQIKGAVSQWGEFVKAEEELVGV